MREKGVRELRNRLFTLSVLGLVVAMVTLAVACQQAAPAPTQAPAKPTAAPAAAPTKAPEAAPTKAPAAPTAAPKAAAWTPEKDLEFVVHAAAGGGSDIQARTMEKVIRDEKLYPKNIAVVNKVGGSGAVAFAYVAGKKGDPYYWLTATTSFFTTPARGQVPVSYKDFTMLARLSDDNFFVLVRDDSPYKTMKDLLDAAKAKPKSIKWGGTNVGSDDHIFMYLLQKATGTEFNFISLQSGGEVMTNVLGGHVDVASANPGEALPQVEAKKVRLLAVGGDSRMEKYKDVPTLKEQGINFSYSQTRMIAAPAGLPAGAREYWAGLLKKMTESKGWKEYLDKNDQQPNFMEGAQLDKYVADLNEQVVALVKDLGLVEKK